MMTAGSPHDLGHLHLNPAGRVSWCFPKLKWFAPVELRHEQLTLCFASPQEVLNTSNQTIYENSWLKYGGFPEMGVPPNHPFQVGFLLINQPFWGTLISGNLHMMFQTEDTLW